MALDIRPYQQMQELEVRKTSGNYRLLINIYLIYKVTAAGMGEGMDPGVMDPDSDSDTGPNNARKLVKRSHYEQDQLDISTPSYTDKFDSSSSIGL